MTKKNNLSKSKDENEKRLFQMIGQYIKEKYPFLILLLVGYLCISALNFLRVSTSDSVANYSLSDFEIGQIADRTIVASKSFAPDELDPIAIEDGEKIIKKGFPITEEGYAKLKKMSDSPVYIDYRAFANSELFFLVLVIVWYLLFSFLVT